jgi:hypothetical protein
LAVAGRIFNLDLIRAVVLSAHDAGWTWMRESSRILNVKNLDDELEKFPALVFEPNILNKVVPPLKAMADFYRGVEKQSHPLLPS